MVFIMTEDPLFSGGRQNKGTGLFGNKGGESDQGPGSPCNKTPLLCKLNTIQTGGIATAQGFSIDHLSTESFSGLSISKESL